MKKVWLTLSGFTKTKKKKNIHQIIFHQIMIKYSFKIIERPVLTEKDSKKNSKAIVIPFLSPIGDSLTKKQKNYFANIEFNKPLPVRIWSVKSPKTSLKTLQNGLPLLNKKTHGLEISSQTKYFKNKEKTKKSL